MDESDEKYTIFSEAQRVGQGTLREVAGSVLQMLDADPLLAVLVFNDRTGKVIDVDLQTVPPELPRSVGRPKLGVVAREVTLLPRHWAWLNAQPGGASVALRKLVEAARRTHESADRQRASRDATYEFLVAMAGNEPGFEEAIRALYRGNRESFEALIGSWPGDIPAHAKHLAAEAFPAEVA